MIRCWTLVVLVGLLAAACSPAGTTHTASKEAAPPRSAASTIRLPATSSLPDPGREEAPSPLQELVVPPDPRAQAREYGLYAPDGTYVGPVNEDGMPLVFEPVEGFGDFSDTDYFLVDWQQVNAATVTCVRHFGFPLKLHADGLGADWSQIPPEQNQLAQAVYWACYAGLAVPNPVPFNDEQWAEIYAYELALADCLRARGYAVPEAPSLDRFVETEGRIWGVYIQITAYGPEWDELVRACPPAPPGGYGAWDPGDPVGTP